MEETIKQITINGITRNVEDSYARNQLANKQDKLTIDEYPDPTSYNPVSSKGVYEAIASVTPVEPGGSGGNAVVFAGTGTIEAAKLRAGSVPFQWLLVQPYKGDTITKVIWYIGNGKFIDALGAEIS